MHEASIALSIIEIAEEHCRKAGYTSVRSIEVDIGSASGVLPDALVMAFDIVKLETIAGDADLLVNEIPIGGRCGSCQSDFAVHDMFVLSCPSCGGTGFEITSGRELDIKEIEVY